MLSMPTPAALTGFLIELAKDGFVAALASWLAVRQALRQFSSQRWWERQEEAYRKIVDGLSQIQVHLARMDNMGAEYRSEEDQRKRWSLASEKVEDLERISHEGAFRISNASNLALVDLITSWYPPAPVGEGLEQFDLIRGYKERVDHCLKVIDAEARKDLGLPRRH